MKEHGFLRQLDVLGVGGGGGSVFPAEPAVVLGQRPSAVYVETPIGHRVAPEGHWKHRVTAHWAEVGVAADSEVGGYGTGRCSPCSWLDESRAHDAAQGRVALGTTKVVT